MFIVVNETHTRIIAIGPFPTAARASGAGFSRYGARTFGNPNRWYVMRIEGAK